MWLQGLAAWEQGGGAGERLGVVEALNSVVGAFTEFLIQEASDPEQWQHRFESRADKHSFADFVLRSLFVLQCYVQHLAARYLLEVQSAASTGRSPHAPPRGAVLLLHVFADAFLLLFAGLPVTLRHTYLADISVCTGVLQTLQSNSSPLLAPLQKLACYSRSGPYQGVHVLDLSR